MKHLPPITAYTRIQAPCYDVSMTSQDTGSQSETPCIVATEAAAMVTDEKTGGAWLERDNVISHEQVTHKFVDNINATDANNSCHGAASLVMLNATSAADACADETTAVEWSRVSGATRSRQQRVAPRTSSTLQYRRCAAIDGSTTDCRTTSRYVIPPRLRTIR